MNEEYGYARHAARALMELRRKSTEEVAAETGINVPVLTCFLSGNDTVLSDVSFHLLFSYLGVTASEEGAKFAPDRVHYLHLSSAPFLKSRHIRMFRVLLPLMDSVSALELRRYKGITPVLVRGPKTRIVLLVRNGRLGGIGMRTLGLVPGSFRGYESIAEIPRNYLELLVSKQVKANYFDLILQGSFTSESIGVIQLMALDRDVTLSEIVGGLASGKFGPLRERDVVIDDTAYYREKVVRLYPNHFRAQSAA